MDKVPVYSIHNRSIIAEAEVAYGQRIGINCRAEVVRVILRDSGLFLEDEINNWPSTQEVLVPVGTGCDRVVQEAKRQGLAYKVRVYYTPQGVRLHDYWVDEGQTFPVRWARKGELIETDPTWLVSE